MNISNFPLLFSEDLISYLEGKLKNYASALKEGVIYAVSKGKRIRPLAVYLSAKTFGGEYQDIRLLAFVIELIHSYSLVHDDLPAMDNDDFRRGEPTVHKKFGHAQGILIGDLLLTLAGDIALEYSALGAKHNKAVREIFINAGKMVDGQFMEFSDSVFDKQALLNIYERKTTALIKASLLAGACALGCSDDDYESLSVFGQALGLLFQISDDFFDLEEDIARGVKTIPVLLGKEQALIFMEQLKNNALNVLKNIQNNDYLQAYFDLLINRKF